MDSRVPKLHLVFILWGNSLIYQSGRFQFKKKASKKAHDQVSSGLFWSPVDIC